mgnify:CR=1 FL=1
MFIEHQIAVKKEKTRESFRRHTQDLRGYISDEEYRDLEDFFVDSAMATINIFYTDYNDNNPFGRDYTFYIEKYRFNNNEIEVTYRLLSKNANTGLIEYGDTVLTSENRRFNLDEHKINSLIKDAFNKLKPINVDSALDWSPHSKNFKQLHVFDVAKINLHDYLNTHFKRDGRSSLIFDRQFIQEIDAQIEVTKRMADSEEDEEKIKNLRKELTKLRSRRHKTPSHKIHIFMDYMRQTGVRKQKLKTLFGFYKRAISSEDRKILSSFFQYNPYHVNVLNGYSSHDTNSNNEVKTRALYRNQALERYPIFGKHLFSSYGDSSLSAIDNGVSPEKALVVHGDFLKSTKDVNKIKYFQNLKWQRVGTEIVHDSKHLDKMIKLLSPLNKDHLPQTKKGWFALNTLIRKTNPSNTANHDFGFDFIASKIVQNSFGRNKSYGNVDYYSNQRSKEEIEEDISGIMDFMSDFTSKVVFPHIVRYYENNSQFEWDTPEVEDCYPIISELLAGFSLSQLIKISNDWHSEQRMDELRRIMSLASLNLPAEWPKIIDYNFETSNGLAIVALANTQALIEEGKRMSHCVGTYADKCMYQGSNIVSVRDEKENSLSTAEIVFDKFKTEDNQISYKVRVLQHRAHKNHEPSIDAKSALNEFIDAIKQNKVSIQEEVVQRQIQKEHLRTVSQLHRRIGFNPDNSTGVGDMMLSYYSRYLKKNYKNALYNEIGGEIVKIFKNNKDLLNTRKQEYIASGNEKLEMEVF